MSEEARSRSISDFESVPGGAELLAWFGYVPSFHDAKIISLHLNQIGKSALQIHTWRTTDKIDGQGYYILDKHVVVTFTLEDIATLELEDFSIQSIIFGLELKKIKTKLPSFAAGWGDPPSSLPDLYEIILEPCYGLHGKIQAHRVSITLMPGKPDEAR